MNDIEPFKCGVIASELKSISMCSSEYLQRRFIALYETAIKHKHNAIVLGAWGCGAFKETDDDVIILAHEFKIFADKYKDKIKIVFAIIGKNYKLFLNNYV
ncbi:hypothetical protein BMW23_0363 [Bodo saltans virus]|jgi:uncharacterized protein (TIGR02452 family)|uniref:Microbial-type PARG catalytic domain-containing protein n=1 Tax=Bodo saltans virus TaxID=2024608 RepID=A0A2H4UU39_9VIRU|nr:hypothetical protein QJ851_gp0355 [Bodo saltans virus]ATZ80418.1 hypothetical protein BMW23_0363 [Bodo saltans virus]